MPVSMPAHSSPRRFGVLGSADVGQVLAQGLRRHGYEVQIASRTPAKLAEFSREAGIPAATFAEVARWAEALVLAVKGDAALDALAQAGGENLRGKLVMDATNPITAEPPEAGVIRYFTGPNDSLMERLQQAYPEARFVKAFNSVGSALMVNPSLPGGPPTMFYCGNDAGAKAVVRRLIEQFGWMPEDMGAVQGARALESLAQLWCIPGFLRDEWGHAFKLVRG